MQRLTFLGAALALALTASTAMAQSYGGYGMMGGYGYGPGMMYGYGPGMMYGYGYGPGMMYGYGYNHYRHSYRHRYGHGYDHGYGMMGPGWYGGNGR
jgi:periplasmic protein CpxP/Spy